jgi:hypothetical protein
MSQRYLTGRRWLSKWKSPSISILETLSARADLMRALEQQQYAGKTDERDPVKGTQDEKGD